ncbi:delta(1)-pyrroline-2-carboxylate reductase family protein [Variovorax sp. RHLX14]|uniref:delta(1)-pyrroline-2-carboxylate reductase family protein n=1 Tax=Variovorax sp. RHLX14 TaxID=1259731 RepID=UPI003F474966
MIELDATETDARIAHDALMRALDRMLALRTDGLVHCPTRGVLPLAAGGRLLSMLAGDGTHALTKTVTVHPDNARFSLPRVQAEAVVMRSDNGQRIALLDGDVLTLRRTAALSVLAATKLAPSTALRATPGLRLVIIGAGVQARAHAEAFIAQGEVASIRIHARNEASALGLAEELAPSAQNAGVEISWVDDLAAALASADIVVTATNSMEPVMSDEAADAIADGTVVCAVGAFTAQMSELPPSLVRRSFVVVDALTACLAEAGDLIKAGVDWDAVQELAVDTGAPADADSNQRPIVFKSVGCALWDLAAANCVLESLQLSVTEESAPTP